MAFVGIARFLFSFFALAFFRCHLATPRMDRYPALVPSCIR